MVCTVTPMNNIQKPPQQLQDCGKYPMGTTMRPGEKLVFMGVTKKLHQLNTKDLITTVTVITTTVTIPIFGNLVLDM